MVTGLVTLMDSADKAVEAGTDQPVGAHHDQRRRLLEILKSAMEP